MTKVDGESSSVGRKTMETKCYIYRFFFMEKDKENERSDRRHGLVQHQRSYRSVAGL